MVLPLFRGCNSRSRFDSFRRPGDSSFSLPSFIIFRLGRTTQLSFSLLFLFFPMGEWRREGGWAWSDDDSDGSDSQKENLLRLWGVEWGDKVGREDWVFSDGESSDPRTHSSLGKTVESRKEDIFETSQEDSTGKKRSGSFNKITTKPNPPRGPPTGPCSTSGSLLPLSHSLIQFNKRKGESLEISSPVTSSLSSSLLSGAGGGDNGLPIFHSMKKWIKGSIFQNHLTQQKNNKKVTSALHNIHN